MCFGQKTPDPVTPAPAPAPPDPVADEQSLTSSRREEDLSKFGTTTPSLRSDRTATSAGATSADGTGLRLM